MSEVLRRRWQGGLGGSGLPRRETKPCDYEVYVPDRLGERGFSLSAEVAADVSDAEAAIARLNVEASALVNTEAMARILLRAEAVASSRIEGLVVGARRLLRAEALRESTTGVGDVTANEVLNNIDAMVFAVNSVHRGDPITVELLLGVHQRLLAGTRLDAYGGLFRQQQNWIGGSDYNPRSAAFVPPPQEMVPELMQDLCEFSNSDSIPPVAQAAIAHAQFETIHPFIDGNGRTGRALIHLILRRRGMAERALPPISLVLATQARSYVEGLTAFRYVGEADCRAAADGTNVWVARFAAACTRAVHDAMDYEEAVAAIQAEWRTRLAPIRANSATDHIINILPGAPVITIDSAARMLQRTFNPANQAIQRLVAAGILRQVNTGRRNRAYEAPEIIAAFTALERQLASPTGDTRTARPARHVPNKPQ